MIDRREFILSSGALRGKRLMAFPTPSLSEEHITSEHGEVNAAACRLDMI